jgi:hypothetical protein
MTMTKKGEAQMAAAFKLGEIRFKELIQNLNKTDPIGEAYAIWVNLICSLAKAGWTEQELAKDVTFYTRDQMKG